MGRFLLLNKNKKAGITVIAVPVYSEDDGEFLGYAKKYVD